VNRENDDFVIVGAGIVGLSTALELRKRYPDASIAILEKEPRPGMHASGRNSGVLHSGIYYGSDTLKAKVCSIGNARMQQFAKEHGIPCYQSGKVIIATSEEDLPVVERLLGNARQNKIRAECLGEQDIKKIEPFSNPYKVGIYCPDTAVIDNLAVVNKLAEILTAQKVDLVYGQEVIHINPRKRKLQTRSHSYGYGFLFNCAGANADRIARYFGIGGDYALLPFKGIYYELSPEKRHLVKGNIYPVPDINLPFLGVHLTRVISGEVYVGPTAIPAFGRENYGFFKGLKIGESVQIIKSIGCMYLKNHQAFRRLVHAELKKYSKYRFVEATRRLVPALTGDDLLPSSKVGIRPQLVNTRTKRLEMDYIVEETSNSIHILNAISPAFTSAFAFAELLVDRLKTIETSRGAA